MSLNTLPPPALGSTQSRPPWRSTMRREIARPSPVPRFSAAAREHGRTCRRRARPARARCRSRCRRPPARRRARPASADGHRGVTPAAVNFIALASRLRNTRWSCPRSAATTGSSPISTVAPRSTTAAEVAQHARHDSRRRHALGAQLGRPGAGEQQQVVDHPLHALDAGDRVADELAGAVVEPVAVLALEQRDEARDRAQRLGEIVGGDVGEGLEVGVRAFELGAGALALDDPAELDADLAHHVSSAGSASAGDRRRTRARRGPRAMRIGNANPGAVPPPCDLGAAEAGSCRRRSPTPARRWPDARSAARAPSLCSLAYRKAAKRASSSRYQTPLGCSLPWPGPRGRRGRPASACARRRGRSPPRAQARSRPPRSTPPRPSPAARARPGARRAAVRSRPRCARPRAGPALGLQLLTEPLRLLGHVRHRPADTLSSPPHGCDHCRASRGRDRPRDHRPTLELLSRLGDFAFAEYPFGGASIDAHGTPLTDETLAACRRPTRSCWPRSAARSGTPPTLTRRDPSKACSACARRSACTPTCARCARSRRC